MSSTRSHNPIVFLGACLLAITLFSLGNCTSNNANQETTTEQPADAGGSEKASDAAGCGPNVPAPSAPCIPKCGNEFQVGQPCTRGGGECSNNPNSFLCTGDFNKETNLLYCTKPCVKDEDCGANAKCTGNPDNPAAGRGCIPAACVSNDDKEPSPREPNTNPDTSEPTTNPDTSEPTTSPDTGEPNTAPDAGEASAQEGNTNEAAPNP